MMLEHTPRDFFGKVYRAFRRAEKAANGPIVRFYSIGGRTIGLHFAGPALIPVVTPALEHLAAEPDPDPALTVCLWDSMSTRTKIPTPPWSAEDYITRGEIRGYDDERFRMAFHLGSYILSMLDAEEKLAIYWTSDASSVPYYETGAPLRTILHWFARSYGCQIVHSAAVGTSFGGVLLTGRGGSGKSTTSLACLSSELLYAGDDYVLLAGKSTPYVYSLYNSAKVDVDSIDRLPHLLAKVSNAERIPKEKALLFLKDHYPHKLTKGFPVRAILIPRITGRPESRFKKASPSESLRALAPSTIFQLPGARDETLLDLVSFVKKVPSYTLELGTELSQINEMILYLLSMDGQ
jgi:hypothetical protein